MGHHINSPGADAFPGEARPGPNHLVLLPCLFALFEYLSPDVIMLVPELFGQRFEESLGHSRHGLLRSVYVAKGWLAFPSSGVLSTHCLTGRSADEFQARLTTDMAKRNRVPELLQPARSTISGWSFSRPLQSSRLDRRAKSADESNFLGGCRKFMRDSTCKPPPHLTSLRQGLKSRGNRSPSRICQEQNETHNMGLLVFEQRRATA